MTAALVSVLAVLAFLAAIAAYSLRDFSRSRLDEICRAHGRENRFSQIMREYEHALVAVEVFQAAVSIAIIVLLVNWLGLTQPPAPTVNAWSLLVARCLGLLAVWALVLHALPWTIARVAGEPYLYRAWPALMTLTAAFKPVVVAATQLDTYMHRLSGQREPQHEDSNSLTEEIRTVVDEGQREGLLESGARTMIHRVIGLAEMVTTAIMTPRTNMVCVTVDSTLEQARQQLLNAGHSRVPVIGETTDDIVGILYAKDLLRYLNTDKHKDVRLREIVREQFYVPETTGVDTLLEMMKRKRVHIAIVVDEYGGVAGLVSLEDILEEIVGEIVDEYDRAVETGIHVVSPTVTEVESRVRIDELNEQFGFGLPEDGDFDTIGGFVYAQLHRVPAVKDSFTWRQLRFIVLDADKRKIRKLRIEADESLVAASPEQA